MYYSTMIKLVILVLGLNLALPIKIAAQTEGTETFTNPLEEPRPWWTDNYNETARVLVGHSPKMQCGTFMNDYRKVHPLVKAMSDSAKSYADTANFDTSLRAYFELDKADTYGIRNAVWYIDNLVPFWSQFQLGNWLARESANAALNEEHPVGPNKRPKSFREATNHLSSLLRNMRIVFCCNCGDELNERQLTAYRKWCPENLWGPGGTESNKWCRKRRPSVP